MGEEQHMKRVTFLPWFLFFSCIQGIATLKYVAFAFCTECCNDLCNFSVSKKFLKTPCKNDLQFGDWAVLFSCSSLYFIFCFVQWNYLLKYIIYIIYYNIVKYMNILFTLKLWKVALDCSNLFIIQKHSHSLFKLFWRSLCAVHCSLATVPFSTWGTGCYFSSLCVWNC